MWTKIKAVLVPVWVDCIDTYKRIKIFLLAAAALAVYLEWQKIKALWLVKSGQKEISSDNKQDVSLAKAEQTENKQADALVEKAQNEDNPGNDWYVK